MVFFEKMKEIERDLKVRECMVFLPSEEGTGTDYSSMNLREQALLKNKFIDLHLDKIKNSDAILAVNYPKRGVDGYVGANTFLEMGFAFVLGKKIFLLHSAPDQDYKVEILGLQPVILGGEYMKVFDYL